MRSLSLRAALLPLAAAGLVAPFLGGAATAASTDIARSAPAPGAPVVTEDEAGDIDAGVDLRKARLANRDMVRVVLKHDDLAPHPEYGVGASIFFDTDPAEKGPEFQFIGGLFQGTDYMLAEADGWKLGKTVNMKKCFYLMKLDYEAERTVVRMEPGCLGDPGQVRIAVKATADSADGPEHDWLGSRRQFTNWAASSP